MIPPAAAMQRSRPAPTLPDGLTVRGLVEADIELAGMYHDLARRHDELVDWVASLVKRHNERVLKGK